MVHAVKELLAAFHEIGVDEFDVDEFGECNKAVFDYEENKHNQEDVYKALSLVCISFIDLGLLEVE